MLDYNNLPIKRQKIINEIYNNYLFMKSKFEFDEKIGFASLYTTLNCPYDCIHCYSEFDDSKSSIDSSTEDLLRIINILSLFSERIQLTGGEVLVRKELYSKENDLIILLNELKKREKEIIFQTTGYNLSESIIKELKSCGVVWISLSLDGPDIHSNEVIRKNKAFYSNVMKLIPVLKSYGFKIKVGTVITSINSDKVSLLKLSEQINKLKIDKWKLTQFYPRLKGRSSYKNASLLHIEDFEFNQIITYIRENSNLLDTEIITQNSYDYSNNPALLVLPNGIITVTSGVEDMVIGNALTDEISSLYEKIQVYRLEINRNSTKTY